MDRFEYQDGSLHCEGVALRDVAARFGTPCYVYSRDTLVTHFARVREAFTELDPLICFSIKCCSNVHILRLLAEQGSGFDVVSGGELFRARLAGVAPDRIVFAGVGKTREEIREALDAGIGWFNIESPSELEQIESLARERGVTARAALRVNPDVDPKTHAYTTTGTKQNKFGVPLEQAPELFRCCRDSSALRLCGIHLHIGSPVNDPESYVRSITRGLELIAALRNEGLTIDTIDIGGGFGAHYQGGEAPAASQYAARIVPLLRGTGLRVILEPGRSIAANAGILLTRVLHVKDSGAKRFVIVDAAMTELIRPALYSAYHFVWPVEAGPLAPAGRTATQPFDGLQTCDVVGPVCESGDFLARDRALPPLRSGELVAVFTAGAYGSVMSSQYNSRPRAAEVLVHERTARLIRRRETYADLVAAEQV
jgi:diaminopimelate decarboxylase